MLRFQRLLLFIALSFLTRVAFLPVEIIDIDESSHVLGSWTLMRGDLLYKDFVNNKPPLLYVYYAAAQWIFGKGLFAVRLFTILFAVPFTALAVSAFYNHNRTGLIGGAIFLIYSASFLAHDMHSANTELLMILPGAWALVFAKDQEQIRRPLSLLLSGFLIGVGFLLKYQVVFWLPAIAVAAAIFLIQRRNIHQLFAAWILLGLSSATPLVLTYAMFWWKGISGDLIYWTIQNNVNYSANPILLKEAAGRAASYFLPFVLVTSPLWWASYHSIRYEKEMYRKTLFAALLFFTLPAVFLGFRFYPHYFIQLYVPLSLAAAPFASQLLQAPRSKRAILFSVWALLMFTGFTITNVILYYSDRQVYRETDPVFKQVASQLKQDRCFPDATLFVWGYAHPFYYYSGLRPASRFVVLPQSGLTTYISGNLESLRRSPGEGNPKHWQWLMSDLQKNRVTFIIDTSPAAIYRWNHYPMRDYPLLDTLVRENFQLIGVVEGVHVYRRKDCSRQ